MGDLKTYLFGLLMVLIGAATPALAMPDTGPDTGPNAGPDRATEQVRLFATCLGRMSATMEHEWLMGRDGAQARGQRQLFEMLVEAVMPDARRAGLTGAHILHLRIEAKFAQAKLLQAASFDPDTRRKRYAANLAQREIGACNSLALG
ncbi:hypothetical protein [Tropicibacter naphthalenivorans]|uniref:Uncharacterized protein n=1 Tax=Tropicibacter naphthalenivorans TaxID=441103 RepID=A0A0P1G2V4_9RHOB|nr:hypothetical protein [Tropicibacter naphthalenivorans]CUH76142.1 hypothetical protein TRN7648_00802 [Tropicibacter naphthalenivorans]SMC39704.1 hypothetical protein SAMN04488093_10182 [Tropicibacter naphthalenivorans]